MTCIKIVIKYASKSVKGLMWELEVYLSPISSPSLYLLGVASTDDFLIVSPHLADDYYFVYQFIY